MRPGIRKKFLCIALVEFRTDFLGHDFWKIAQNYVYQDTHKY